MAGEHCQCQKVQGRTAGSPLNFFAERIGCIIWTCRLKGGSLLLYNFTNDEVMKIWFWGGKMDFSRDDLIEAKRQIDSTLHKLRKTIETLELRDQKRYKSQITLAKRRVKAFEIADYFIKREIAGE